MPVVVDPWQWWWTWRKATNTSRMGCLIRQMSYISPFIYFKNFYFLILFYLAVPGLSCSMWDLVPWPEIELRVPALGHQGSSYISPFKGLSLLLEFSALVLDLNELSLTVWVPNGSTIYMPYLTYWSQIVFAGLPRWSVGGPQMLLYRGKEFTKSHLPFECLLVGPIPTLGFVITSTLLQGGEK